VLQTKGLLRLAEHGVIRVAEKSGSKADALQIATSQYYRDSVDRLTEAKNKNASKMLALRGGNAIVPNDYCTPGITVCQEKTRPAIHERLAMAFSPGLQ
jgi:hypothetical protein